MEPEVSLAGLAPPRTAALPTSRAGTVEVLLWGMAAILIAGLVAVWALRPTFTSEIPRDRIDVAAGRSYLARLSFEHRFLYVVQGDRKGRPSRSELALFEDGAPLGPAHSLHRHIAEQGGGAYSHWDGTLVFSSSDGTDPRTNGRRYSVRVGAEPRLWLLWSGIFLAMAIAAGALGARQGVVRGPTTAAALRTLPAAGASLLVGLAAGEGLTRLAMHPSLDYTSIFSPGPYCPDPDGETRATSVCPRTEGVMRPAGSRHFASYRLNELGYRGPFRSPGSASAPRKSIVILGGQSQGFGFGLNDDQTYAAVAARSGCGPVEVHNLALVGTSNPVTWDIYKSKLADRIRADHVILAFYWQADANWQDLIDMYRARDPQAVLYGWPFDAADGPGLLRNFHGVMRSVVRARDVRHYVAEKLLPLPFPLLARAEADLEAADAKKKAEDLARQQQFVRAVADWAARNGAAFSVVRLPAEPSANEALRNGLGPIRFVDLDSAARDAGVVGGATGWSGLLPDGHYDADTAAFLGRRIGREICEVDFPEAAQAESVVGAVRH